jgi:hypothetical protein
MIEDQLLLLQLLLGLLLRRRQPSSKAFVSGEDEVEWFSISSATGL